MLSATHWLLSSSFKSPFTSHSLLYLFFFVFLLFPCFCDLFVFVFVMHANCALVCFFVFVKAFVPPVGKQDGRTPRLQAAAARCRTHPAPGRIVSRLERYMIMHYPARARSARARRACALRALGLLLADGAPTVGGGKTF